MNRKIIITIVGLASLIYIGTIWYRPLFTPDETRYAEIAREMIQHKNWVVPKLNQLCYFEKPIMGHWLNALSLAVFGESVFSVRFSSAISGLLTALMLGLFVKKYAGQKLAFSTVLIYLTSVLVFGVSTYAVLDGPTTFFLSATLITFFLGYKNEKWGLAKMGWLALAGVACGCAFMTKGFLAFAVPASVIVPFLIWEKKWKQMFTLPWIPLVFVILTAAPWAIMVHKQDNDFWHYFFWVEHIQRFLRKEESQHPEPFWFFIPILLAGTLPWALFLPQIVKSYKGRVKEYFQDSVLRYAACWLVFPFIFFSASSGKLATYILPCFPAAALLFAFGFNKYIEQKSFKSFDITVKILGYILLAAIGVLAVGELIYFAGWIPVGLYSKGEIVKWLLATAAIICWGLLLLAAAKAQTGQNKMLLFASGAAVAMLAFHFIVPNIIQDKKAPGAFLEQFKDRINDDTIVVSYKNLASSVCWYYKRDNVYIYHKGGELTYGLDRADAKGRLINEEEFAEMVKNPKNNVVIIMNSKRLMKTLPESDFRVWKNKRLFQEYKRK
jgi:4-amino-4-deoxy-L-arabinose transferase